MLAEGWLCDRALRAGPLSRPPSIERMSTSEGAPALAVTRSTGWLGGLVARGLKELRVAQRLLIRDLARAPQLEGATVLQSTYGDSTANAEALDGVTDDVERVTGRRPLSLRDYLAASESSSS